MDREEKIETVSPDATGEQDISEEKEHSHTEKRVRVRRRASRKGRRIPIRERVLYYIIIVLGLSLAVLLTWLVLQAISNPNIISGIIKD